MCSAGTCVSTPPGYFSPGGRDPVACSDYTYAIGSGSSQCTPCLPLQPIIGVTNALPGFVCPANTYLDSRIKLSACTKSLVRTAPDFGPRCSHLMLHM